MIQPRPVKRRSKKRRLPRNFWVTLFIVALFVFALWVLLPVDSMRFGRDGMTLGLDLKGGVHLVYQADLEGQDDPDGAMESVIGIITKRVDAYGVTEPNIQKMGTDRILVQLPGITDVEEAVELIGATALLNFREEPFQYDEQRRIIDGIPAMGTIDGKEIPLTGKYLLPESKVEFDQLGQPRVAFKLDDEGAILFEQITKRNLHKLLAIFLDGNCISAPEVRAVLTDEGVITGIGDVDDAHLLADQLNIGALPVGLELVTQQTVDPTLGADAIHKSLIAGIVGLVLLLLFMILYYRFPGVIACLSLIIYVAIVMAIFKVWPVTLTMAGIAGFIISLGMAVDANVLIFERLKEELRHGRTIGSATEVGFNRAWTAIRDGNITTFIVCAILLWFGQTFAASQVMGFALTLFIGVAVSMFTAIIITRTFLRLFAGTRISAKLWLFGVGEGE